MNELGSENEARIKNSSMCLAMIARVEIPVNLHDNFFSIMSSNATENTNLFHRIAAVQTLGYLCEFVGEENDFKQSHIESILHSTILNIADG